MTDFAGFTIEGATVEIGSTTAHASAGEYEADSYTVVGIIEQIPEIGSTNTLVTAQPTNSDEVSAKGTRTFPESTIDIFYQPDDAGLAALEAAEASTSAYAFRIEYNDGATHGTRHYFRALVMGLTYPQGGANDWAMVRASLKMITTITKVAAV